MLLLRRALCACVALLALMLTALPLHAAQAVITADRELPLDAVIDYVEDPSRQLTLDDIMQPGVQWKRSRQPTFNKGYNRSAWWLRIVIHNARPQHIRQWLESGYALLDHLDVYVTSDGKPVASFAMGDRLPYHTRPVDSRSFVIPLRFAPQQTLTVYLRIESTGTVQAPLTLWDPDRFLEADSASTLLQGFYYGGLLAIAIYNLLIYFALRERSYLYYVGFVTSIPLLLATLSGQAYHYLWPDAVRWNNHAVTIFMASSIVFGVAFTIRFLRLAQLSRRLTQALYALLVLAAGTGVLSVIVPYHIAIQIAVALTMIVTVAGIAAGAYALHRGQPSAHIYLAAWVMFLLGAFVLAANKMALLPSNILTEYAAQTGSMIEAVLLSFALAQRINQERRLRYEAQSQALQASQRMQHELEERVQQRTQELQMLNECLQQLSDTDQLTQLKNRRALEACLEQEWSRSLRYRHSLAVVLLDIDHFKAVNDSYGHPAGDSCLRIVASIIADAMGRPGDTAARYGGEEFCLVLPQTTAEQARQLVDTLRQRIAATPMETAATQFFVTASAGVFASVPEQQRTPEDFIRAADAALYRSKQEGRNRVTVGTA